MKHRTRAAAVASMRVEGKQALTAEAEAVGLVAPARSAVNKLRRIIAEHYGASTGKHHALLFDCATDAAAGLHGRTHIDRWFSTRRAPGVVYKVEVRRL